ncbi:hypothetical protein ANN_04239 [Periplaneta americana]|uniref:DUF4817 domain-containing protein n=1 Tax=Periplaneta americana TaxID=6978 RepID=A0ABQ8TAF4_PERAM|nr:hypothetical protein ANN_04239 [Periplaneta americana]
MSPGSSTESYPAFAHIGLRENPGKNLNQVTCPDRESNPGHLVSRLDALTITYEKILDKLVECSEPIQMFGMKTAAPTEDLKSAGEEADSSQCTTMYTVEERIAVVAGRLRGQTYLQVRAAFERRFRKPAPTQQNIQMLVNKFLRTGSVADERWSGRSSTS